MRSATARYKTCFVPEAPTQELRALLRTRKQLGREQASHVQRLQKTLGDANLKLGSVLTQIMGVTGRAILQALIDGWAPISLRGVAAAAIAAVRPRLRAGPLLARAAVSPGAVYFPLRLLAQGRRDPELQDVLPRLRCRKCGAAPASMALVEDAASGGPDGQRSGWRIEL